MNLRNLHPSILFSIALVVATGFASPAAGATLLEQGRDALQRGDADAAIDLLEKAVAENPASADAHFQLGRAYEEKAQTAGMIGALKSISKIRREFERTVALDSARVLARLELVRIDALAPGMMGGSKKRALEGAAAIKRLDPLVGHRAFALVYEAQKRPDLAKEEFVAAVREQPGSPKAHSLLGQYVARVEKDYVGAFAQFDAAIAADPGYMPALYHVGRVAATADSNLTRGEESLKKYLDHAPGENEPSLANAHYWLGSIYEKEGRKAEAKQSYQTALKLDRTLKEAADALKRLP